MIDGILYPSIFCYYRKMISGTAFKIKEGKEEIWQEWCRLLAGEYKDEAIGTLTKEGLSRELFFIFQNGADVYAVGMSEYAEHILPSDDSRWINQKHHEKKKECFEYIGPISVLYELSLKNR
jgi:hypothetical protein